MKIILWIMMDWLKLIDGPLKNGFFLIVLIIAVGCGQKSRYVKNQNTGGAFGTTYSILYIAEQKLNYQSEIDSVIKVVNQSMSTYQSDSDISKINSGDSTVVVDHMFQEVFDISTAVHEISDGYFDPTIGVLANAWGFGPEDKLEMDSTKVDSLLQFVGWSKVKLQANGTIKRQSPNIRFDFNAVAKGYAIDRLGFFLESKGIRNYLVEVGGEILTKGKNYVPEKEWTVGIDNPNNLLKRGSAAVIHLKDKALASSGNYRKFRVDAKTGEKYVHTIDPKTGFTKNSNILATNVIANTCATADALATAFMAMELEDSKRILDSRNDLEGFIIYLDDAGNTQEYMTLGFKELLVN